MPVEKPKQPALKAKDHANDGKYHLLLAASGSVATIKLPNIIQALAGHYRLSIRIILTRSASQFLQGQSKEQPTLEELSSHPNVDGIYLDEDEWKVPWTRNAPILHIELRRWADMLVIAPLSANTLAKLANGLCDNLLTSVVRAWQVEADHDPLLHNTIPAITKTWQKMIIVAPAMNTAMWRHPITEWQLTSAMYPWFQCLRPMEKELACGDTGDGAMHDWHDIVTVIEGRIQTQGIIRDISTT